MRAAGDLLATAALPFLAGRMAWSPDGRWIAVGESSGDSYLGGSTSTGSIAAVDAETGEVNWRVPEWGLNTVVISPWARRR